MIYQAGETMHMANFVLLEGIYQIRLIPFQKFLAGILGLVDNNIPLMELIVHGTSVSMELLVIVRLYMTLDTKFMSDT